jgi:dGTPase
MKDIAIVARYRAIAFDKYPKLTGRRLVNEIVRRMINEIVTDLVASSRARIENAAPADIDAVRRQSAPLIGMSDRIQAEHLELKRFLRERVYQHYRVLRMTSKARNVLTALFNAFFEDLNLMPTEHRNAAARAESERGESGRARVVADYVAGMTDRYAILEHRRVFEPGERT